MKILPGVRFKDPKVANFDSENAYNKPPVILKIIPEAAHFPSTNGRSALENILEQSLRRKS
jgi:hypothetical protein